MSFELLFLGTGTSAGVPMIGCDCAVCHSDDPRDQRSRPSVLIRYSAASAPTQVLIDTAPEMRLQMLRHGIGRLDAVCFTHNHADHILGIDDLRRFNAAMGTHLDIYADKRTTTILREMFRYIFEPHNNVNQSFVATLVAHEVVVGRPFELHGARWTPIPLMHGRLPIVGFRVDYGGKSLAYCTDVSSFLPESYPMLENLDVLVIDALRHRHHPTHMTVEQALHEIDQIKPKRAYLTHIAHDIAHAELEPNLPEGVMIAYDGLSVDVWG
ncbi:MAG: MBL fold metallo-hydrolase [Phycisphaera sp.]|nr:MBL fold metallo-hydrolase [Phycisphaera sp.]